jgi:polyisoprenoid-binding protein YceI
MKLSQIILGAMLALTAGAVQAKDTKKAAVKASKETVLKDIQGTVKWVGYGVGKSHAGTIAVKSGEVVLGEKDTPKQANFVLDMKSLNTPDSAKLTGHLKNEDFFDVEKYPEATFKSTSVTVNPGPKDGVAEFKVSGNLTIKDKTQPIEFNISQVKKDGQFKVMASTEITDRTKYGIVYNSKQFSTVSKLGDKLIEDNIKLDIEVTAK